jgi:hypothetical protein
MLDALVPRLSSLVLKRSKKLSFIIKLLLYSFIYGFFVINIIDVTTRSFWGYHLFLVTLYFFPFIIVVLILGFNDWELLFGLGIISSLMNDLFYAVISNVLFHANYDLVSWFLQQLGFYGNRDLGWSFNGGFFRVEVTSLLMGASIYARVLFAYLVILKWWIENSDIER